MRKKTDTLKSKKLNSETPKDKVSSLLTYANKFPRIFPPQSEFAAGSKRVLIFGLKINGEEYFNKIYDRISELENFFLDNVFVYSIIKEDGRFKIWHDLCARYFEKYEEINKRAKLKALDSAYNEAIITLIETHLESQINKLVKEFTSQHAEFMIDYLFFLESETYKLQTFRETLTHLEFVGRTFDGRRKLNINGLYSLLPDFFVDENGKLIREDTNFAQIFIGVDLTRVRICKRDCCQNFFYANRIDKKCCSKACSDVYNQKLSRERKKENRPIYQHAEKRKKRN